jgi:DNA-binding MarR family transcriptional regulator/GNAT superfamily N-acetyltransferase
MSMVDQVRSFNRLMTERIGVLDDHFLGKNHPLGEARLLWEIGRNGKSVLELRRQLGLDSGYVSRLLRSLEKQGLIVEKTTKNDRRIRFVSLTKSGFRERADLDRRADAFAESLLNPLSKDQREKLVVAMAQVERLLVASMVQITIADPASPDAKWCIDQYFTELDQRFESGFDPALSISADANELKPPAGLLLIAYLREKPIGCAALKFHKNSAAEIKRMWVARQARGLGVGRRLLSELENFAKKAGSNILHLETNRTLFEAIKLYRNSGYTEVKPFNDEHYAHHWFEKRI